MALIWAFVLASTAVVLVSANPYYMIVAPDKLGPHSDYNAAVTVVGTDGPVTITVGLEGDGFKKTSVVTVQPNSTQIAKFRIDDLKPGKFNLTAKGDDNLKFENTTKIAFVEKFQSIFVQTDRAVYKPGQKVQFRVLVLDNHLRPSAQNKIDVILKDGQNNRVKEWKKVEAVKGLYSNEVQLSAHPVLGDWKIVVKSSGKEESKTFSVAEYVLPRFEVTVEVPKYATIANSKVPVTVKALYTYGKPVKGEATIKVKNQQYYYGNEEPQKDNSKTIKVDNVATTEIDVVQAVGLNVDEFRWDTQISFDVEFKEELTGKVLNGTASMTLHKNSFTMSMERKPDYLIPGEDYKVLLKVTGWDGAPYVDPNNKIVKVRSGEHGFWMEKENSTWEEYELSPNGTLEIVIPTDANDTVIHIEAEYMNSTIFDSGYIKYENGEKKRAALTFKVPEKKPKIGDTLEVEIEINEDIPFISYYVTGRKELIESKIIPLSESQKSVKLKLPVTDSMSRGGHLLAAYVSKDGEVNAEDHRIEVENVLNNYVKLSAFPNETEPGKEAVINVETKPNSLVGLLGVDQSAILLKKGNDLSLNEVEIDLNGYDYQWYGGDIGNFRRRRSALPWYPRSPTIFTFDRAGLKVFTNAYIHEEVYPAVPFGSHGGVMFASSAGGTLQNRPEQAQAAPGSSPSREPTITIRQKFPETWIWDILDSSASGNTSLRKTVPDTITSWVITGFSISPEYGLGLSEDPTKVKVFRPFFISLNLPYSVTRGESMVVPVNVFNYMDQGVTVDVTLENPGWFTYTNGSTAATKKSIEGAEKSKTKTIEVGPDSAATANFVITPKEIGYLEVKVTAKSPLAGDGVSRKLLVKPEGETQYRSKGIFIDLREKRELKEDVKLDIPDDVVPDSELIEATAVGDLLGSALDNLDKLIRIPSGCGEQNMLNFVPNIVILDYLKNSQQLTDKIESTALKYIDMGYQRELTYKHKDNSYSAFGERDESGSTWLTAFVAKSFKEAMKFTDIEKSAVIDPLKWIAANQNPNGSFSEVGHVSHKSMQGGGSEGLALTAYVFSTFVEAMEITDEFKDTIDKAANYVSEQIDKGSADIYSLAVASYALELAKHPAKDKAFKLLDSHAKAEGESKWWEKEKENVPDKQLNPWETWIPNSINVEITSYALLSYLQRNMTTEAIPILRWLLSQQNSEGGFASTQDTVVALGAIAKLAKKMDGKGKDISIKFEYSPGASTELKVNEGNALLFQKAELPSRKVRQVGIDAKGSGFAVVQISYRYNINKKGAFPSFKLDIKTSDSSKEHLVIDVCTSYTGGKESNMAVMEVTLPSGYTIDDDGIKALRVTENVKKVETKDGDTVVILYFDKVTSEKLCSTVSAFRTFKVADQVPAPITIYDYYDNSKRATEFYSPPATTLCDICDGEDCQNCDNKV